MKAFTLVEILVVVTIIALLSVGGLVTFTQFGIQSRNTRRKADIEQIRAALEMYRSNSDYSSYPNNVTDLVPDYLKSVPIDPKTSVAYAYTGSPTGCNETTIPCTSYLLVSTLEPSGTYQADPLGAETFEGTTPTPTIGIGIPTPTPTSGFEVQPTPTPTPITIPILPTPTPTTGSGHAVPTPTSTPTKGIGPQTD